MDAITALPALVKVGLAFGLILTLQRLRVHLSICLFGAAVVLGLMMDLAPGQVVRGIAASLWSTEALSLTLIVSVIIVQSKLMNDSGHLERIVTTFSGAVRSVRVVSVVMPALIGLLPMPGGALFSAPMVEAACRGTEDLRPELKTAINYWFRHIWEYWWPLYPGVILAISLLGVEAWRFILFQFPLTLVAAGSGYFFLMKALPAGLSGPACEGNSADRWKAFRHEVLPITLVVLSVPAVTLFKLFTGLPIPAMTSVFLGLGLCLIAVIRQNRIPAADVFKASVGNTAVLSMVVLCLGILAFKGMVVQSQAVAGIQVEMKQFGIPSLLIIMFMPFIAGLVTGIALGFVGSSFPLVVPLIAGTQGLDFFAHASLAYAFGYMGMMLSPIHLCFLVTKDYFHADMLGSYRQLVGPAAAVMLTVFVIFGLIHWLG